MAQQYNVNANVGNFYLDNFGTDDLSIYTLTRSRRKLQAVKEDIELIEIPIKPDQTENHEIAIERVEDSRKLRKVKSGTVYTESSRTCEDCGKVLASAASLYVHLKSHSSNKPYICSECGANFTRKYYLEVHYRTHTGEKPFKCDICDKFFTQKSSLNTHKRNHTGEKPYQCAICDKAFSAQSYLVSHHFTHYPKANGVFTCSSCDLHFENRTQFADHIRTHAKPLDFQCEYCPRMFAKECHLIRHKNGIHGKAS